MTLTTVILCKTVKHDKILVQKRKIIKNPKNPIYCEGDSKIAESQFYSFSYFTFNMRQHLYCSQIIKWKRKYRGNALDNKTVRTSDEN